MYIGPWQEYQLAQEVGTRGGPNRNNEASSPGSGEGAGPAFDDAVASIDGVDSAAFERLVSNLQEAENGQQSGVLKRFVMDHASSGSVAPGVDPKRAAALEKKTKGLKGANRMKKPPTKSLSQLERKRLDFEAQMGALKLKAKESQQQKANLEKTAPKVLPSRPAMLFKTLMHGKPPQVEMRSEKQAPLGPDLTEFNIPFIGQKVPANFAPGQAPRGAELKSVGVEPVSAKNLDARSNQQEPLDEAPYIAGKIGRDGFQPLDRRSELQEPLCSPVFLPNKICSAPLPSLSSEKEGDVDDLLSWSQNLGTGAEDEYLFSDM